MVEEVVSLSLILPFQPILPSVMMELLALKIHVLLEPVEFMDARTIAIHYLPVIALLVPISILPLATTELAILHQVLQTRNPTAALLLH